MALKDLFTGHPASVGESYTEHMAIAGGFGGRMMLAGFACLIHAVLPFLFVRTGSKAVAELHERMVTHRVGADRQEEAAGSEEVRVGRTV